MAPRSRPQRAPSRDEHVLAPLMLWEPKPRSGERMGFACLPMPWRSAHSQRRYLHLQLVAIDDSFDRLTLRGDVLDAAFKNGDSDRPSWCGEWCSAVVDVDTGATTLDPERPHTSRAVELALRLAPLLKRRAVLAGLRREWDQFRALLESVDEVGAPGDWVDRDWSWWEPGRPVSWLEVDPLDHDVYELDGWLYACNDRYCVTPGCDCGEVEVGFFRVGRTRPRSPEDEEVVAAGFVRLAGGRLERADLVAAPSERPLLERLWRLFQERHLASARLGWRRQEMRRIGPDIARLSGHGEPAAARTAARAKGTGAKAARSRTRSS